MARSLFLRHVRASLTQLTSPPSLLLASRNSLNLRSLLLSTSPKHFEPGIFKHGSSWRSKLFAQGLQFSNFSKSGNYSSTKRICGLSITFGIGSIYLWPKIALAMDGFEVVRDDYDGSMNYKIASEAVEKYCDVLELVRKLVLPIFLVLTVVTNWGQPCVLVVAKAILFLIISKPSPFSVYIYIEELRHQHMKRHPTLYKFKSTYAKKVDIEDYRLLCVAKVEINEENLTLIGILGSWWALPSLQIEEAFVAVKKRLYSTRYVKD